MGHKRLYAKSLTAGVQGPLLGPESSRFVVLCSLVLSGLIFKHSDTKWDFKKHSRSNFKPVAPSSKSTTALSCKNPSRKSHVTQFLQNLVGCGYLVAVTGSMWLLWGLCCCYGVYISLIFTQIPFRGSYRKASSRGAYGHDPFWRASTWFHNNRYYNGTIYIIDSVIVLSDLVESSGYSSKTLQKGSCPYAPLDKVLWYRTALHERVTVALEKHLCVLFIRWGIWTVFLISMLIEWLQ